MDIFIEFMNYIWGIPLTIFIVIASLYFCYCTKFLQFTGIKKIYNNTIKKIKNKNSYETMTLVLGGTIGAGNVVGVATAIAVGGPGAIFWMWVIAFLSMATKMVEVTIAVKYHKKENNKYVGGPMYYIKNIKGKIGNILAYIYLVFLLIYVICDSGFIQMNTAATAIIDTFDIPKWIIALFLISGATMIVYGGLKRVSNVLKKMVPIMFIFYFLTSIIVIILNIKNIPAAFVDIFKYAFTPAPVIGGFAGASIISAISKGASRGIFANDSGTGVSTIVHSTTENEPIVQGMWGIVEVFIVSFIICTLTALLVMSTGVWTSGLNGSPLVLSAFESTYGMIGKYIVCFILVTFTCSTYISYYYEYIICIRYLFKEKFIKYLKWLYIVPIIFAVFMPIELIWTMADLSVGFIIIPNIIALFILSKKFKEIFNKSINNEEYKQEN